MNWDMLGHEWAVDLLRQHIVQGVVRHAYLFSGPQGVGRRTLALRLVQALNCPQPATPGEPCRTCRICRQTERMAHSDLVVVQAEFEGGTLKVDQVRSLQYSLALHPYEARYRVAIMLRFEEANLNAANALLKTLEEPGPQVVLILTAESAESLLSTVVSRCEVLRLRPLPLDRVEHGLQTRWDLSPERAKLLAHISGGRPGYALRLQKEPGHLEQRQIWLDDHSRMLLADRVERFAFAETLSKDKEALRGMLAVWLSFWRDVVVSAAGASIPIANLDRREEVERLVSQFGLKAACGTVSALETTLNLLERNTNIRLATEVLMLELPRT